MNDHTQIRFSYKDLQVQANKINELLQSSGGKVQIQKIFSTCHSIVFKCRLKGDDLFIYVGRGEGHVHLYSCNEDLSKSHRIQDKYLLFLRRNFLNYRLANIEVLENDRILCFSFVKDNEIRRFYVMYRGNFCYFLITKKDTSEELVYKSWLPKWLEGTVELSQILSELNFTNEGKDRTSNDNSEIQFELIKQEIQSHGSENIKKEKKSKKSAEKKILAIEQDVIKLANWRRLQNSLENTTSEVISTFGLKIKLPSSNTYYQNRNLVFQKIKSYKKAEISQHLRLEKAILESLNIKEKKEVIINKIAEPQWGELKPDSISRSQKNHAAVDYFFYKKFKFAIGKDANANDWLRINWAKKNDIWIHLKNVPSSHVFVKSTDFVSIGPEILDLVGSMMAEYAKIEIPDGLEIIYTSAGNLKPVKGFPGKVIYKKERIYRFNHVSNWRAIISPSESLA